MFAERLALSFSFTSKTVKRKSVVVKSLFHWLLRLLFAIFRHSNSSMTLPWSRAHAYVGDVKCLFLPKTGTCQQIFRNIPQVKFHEHSLTDYFHVHTVHTE